MLVHERDSNQVLYHNLQSEQKKKRRNFHFNKKFPMNMTINYLQNSKIKEKQHVTFTLRNSPG